MVDYGMFSEPMAKRRLMPCNSLMICILIRVSGMFDPWSRQLVVHCLLRLKVKPWGWPRRWAKGSTCLSVFPTCVHTATSTKKVQRCPLLWQQHPNFRDFSHGVCLSDGVCHVRKITVCCEGADAWGRMVEENLTSNGFCISTAVQLKWLRVSFNLCVPNATYE